MSNRRELFLKRLQQVAAWARLVGILLLVGLVGVVGYYLYDFYTNKVGYTPAKAVDAYFAALSEGDYEQVYQLTSKTDLTDIYGRPITKSEFLQQLRELMGPTPLAFKQIKVNKLAEKGDAMYFEVYLDSNVGGAPGQSRVLVEARREEGGWHVVYPFAIIL